MTAQSAITHVHDYDGAAARRLVRDQLTADIDPRLDDWHRKVTYDNVIAELGDCPICLRAVIAELVRTITGQGDGGRLDGASAYRSIIEDITRRDPAVTVAGLSTEDVFDGYKVDDIAETARLAAADAFDAGQPNGIGLTAAVFAYVRTFDAEAAAHKAGVLSGKWDGYGVPADWNGARP